MLSRSGSPSRMSREDVEYFRAEFYDRMVRDIDREIAWQRTNPNALAGNVLCALGLVVYTEVLGRVAIQQLEGRQPRNRDAFDAFLRRMGAAYDAWRRAWERKHRRSVYDALRNGLAHEYVPKVGSKVWFYFEPQEGFGLGEESEYPLVLKMRPYFDDFRKAGDALMGELTKKTATGMR